jgi:hypothetical protein
VKRGLPLGAAYLLLSNLFPAVLFFDSQQIRAIPLRFLEGSFAAPAANFFMISAEQNFRHGPTAEFGGTRVVRKVEEEVTRDPLALSRDEG